MVRKHAVAAEPESEPAAPIDGAGDGRDVAADDVLPDPWFAPGPKIAQPDEPADAAGNGWTADGSAAADSAADPDSDSRAAEQAEWFLRTGRAGLPDSMTVSWDDAQETRRPDHEAHAEAAGAPPWASDAANVAASTPPPWETGPWPGPGEAASPGSPGQPSAAGRAGRDGPAAGYAEAGGAPAAAAYSPMGHTELPDGRLSARTVLVAGLLPLVLPGLALGILGLRQVRPRPAVRRASWLAIGASVAWAVIIVAIIAGSSGGSTVGCARYPTQVRQAYAKVMTDISTHAAGSVEAADMSVAATLANASAAAAGQIGTRTGLFTMAGDMAQARADVVAHRPVPVTLKQHLADDGAVPAGFCAS